MLNQDEKRGRLMTKIVICGANGKMGHTVASCIAGRDDCTVVGGVDSYTEKYADFSIVATPAELPEVPEVIIDFSNPSTLDELLEYALVNNVALVLATTGYDDAQIQKIQSAAQQIPVFFTFNMSLGINLLVELAKKAATILGGQFDIEIVEKHHNQKIDAPSGTAILLADAVNEGVGGDLEYVYDRSQVRQKRDRKELGLSAVRGGTIVGDHEVIFAGQDEVIEFTHSAHSKEVFAVGAVKAAKFIKGKKPGIYDMQDVMSEI